MMKSNDNFFKSPRKVVAVVGQKNIDRVKMKFVL